MIIMGETAKSRDRRIREGWFEKYIKDPGIDIGCGYDPLNDTFRKFDQIFGDGDATYMNGVEDESYSTVYISHCLEHIKEPILGIRNWYRILKPSGYMIIDVPHRDLYEKKIRLPSNWNGDHKTFWLPDRAQRPITRSLLHTVKEAVPDAEIIDLRVLDEGYVRNGKQHSGGEYSIEIILRKPKLEIF